MDGAAGQALDGSAEQTPAGDWAAQNGVDGLAGLEVAQHGFFAVVQLFWHRWYCVEPWELSWEPGTSGEPEKLCESCELPESKKQGKPKYLWEPWKRSKPGQPGKLSGAVRQEQENRTLSRPPQPRFSQ